MATLLDRNIYCPMESKRGLVDDEGSTDLALRSSRMLCATLPLGGNCHQSFLLTNGRGIQYAQSTRSRPCPALG